MGAPVAIRATYQPPVWPSGGPIVEASGPEAGCQGQAKVFAMSAQEPGELGEAFAAAINGGDADAALALWEDSSLLVAADGTALRGPAQIEPALRAMVAAGTRLQVRLHSLHRADGVAIGTGTLVMTARDGSAAASESVVVYRRGPDGRWRIAIDMPWGAPAPAPPASAGPQATEAQAGA